MLTSHDYRFSVSFISTQCALAKSGNYIIKSALLAHDILLAIGIFFRTLYSPITPHEKLTAKYKITTRFVLLLTKICATKLK